MRILANREIRKLFCLIAALSAAALLGSWFVQPRIGVLVVLTAYLCAVCAALGGYFRHQDRTLEAAAARIERFLDGDKDARIECAEEGELYRLFFQINRLGAVLSAHADDQQREKEFLKNTISDISHQLKTPLSAISIYNDLILEGESLEECKAQAAYSEKEIERIDTLVCNLLKITRLDAGSIVLEQKPENLSEIMKDIALHYTYRAAQEKKQLTMSGADDLMLRCDRDWIAEAIDNLVKNAFDHTRAGDRIDLAWSKPSSSMLRITVSDTGEGIHADDIHYIFKRFYRSRYAQDRQGLGLGLPLAKTIIESHGGRVEVESEPGCGTIFTVSFANPTEL